MATLYTGRQAIQTRYHGATNYKGSRISARCAAGKIYLPYDHASDLGGNHAAAAETLARKMEWLDHGEKFVGGCLPTGDYAWVFVSREG